MWQQTLRCFLGPCCVIQWNHCTTARLQTLVRLRNSRAEPEANQRPSLSRTEYFVGPGGTGTPLGVVNKSFSTLDGSTGLFSFRTR